MSLIPSLFVFFAWANSALACDSTLAAARAFARFDRSHRLDRLQTPMHWPIDGDFNDPLHAASSYNVYFGPSLGGRTIEDVARARRDSGRAAHALDLFGSALFSSEPAAFDSLTGVRRDPLSSAHEMNLAPRGAEDRVEIRGDLLLPSTWRRLDTDADRRGIPAFDLIFVRPVGALIVETKDFLLFGGTPAKRRAFFAAAFLFVNRAWRRLSPDGGRLFLEINPLMVHSIEFRGWVRALEDAGVEYALNRINGELKDLGRVLTLVRRPNSPARLP